MDWIKARFECSMEHVWASLKDRLKQDAPDWEKKVKPQGSIARFLEFTDENRSLRITAFRQETNTNGSVFVSRTNRKISGYQQIDLDEDTKTPAMEFSPTVNSQGECRLLWNDRELEIWQVSRLLLEPILFS